MVINFHCGEIASWRSSLQSLQTCSCPVCRADIDSDQLQLLSRHCECVSPARSKANFSVMREASIFLVIARVVSFSRHCECVSPKQSSFFQSCRCNLLCHCECVSPKQIQLFPVRLPTLCHCECVSTKQSSSKARFHCAYWVW